MSPPYPAPLTSPLLDDKPVQPPQVMGGFEEGEENEGYGGFEEEVDSGDEDVELTGAAAAAAAGGGLFEGLDAHHHDPSTAELHEGALEEAQEEHEGVIVVGGWAKYPDPESGASYWYNHDTGASQWDVPHEVAEYRRTGAHPHDDQEAVHEVHDLDDLFS